MTRQSKNSKKRILAKDITKMHLSGQRGAKKTTPKHGKRPENRMYSASRRGGSKK